MLRLYLLKGFKPLLILSPRQGFKCYIQETRDLNMMFYDLFFFYIKNFKSLPSHLFFYPHAHFMLMYRFFFFFNLLMSTLIWWLSFNSIPPTLDLFYLYLETSSLPRPVTAKRENLSECDSIYWGARTLLRFRGERLLWAQVLAALQVLEVDGRKDGSQLGSDDCLAVLPLNHWQTGSIIDALLIKRRAGMYGNA